jgi:hypothetical protein
MVVVRFLSTPEVPGDKRWLFLRGLMMATVMIDDCNSARWQRPGFLPAGWQSGRLRGVPIGTVVAQLTVPIRLAFATPVSATRCELPLKRSGEGEIL